MGFSMKDFQKMQAQAQKMQAQLMKAQEDLQNTTFEGVSGGGAVTLTINGKYEVTAVKLNPEAVDPEDVGMLEDLILTAFQDAFGKVADAQAQMMQSIGLPPGMGF